ncbi:MULTISPECIES: hypothetical protein [unclassified Kribbella]|uniref:hypothetical protein n=1 Tax=unclassified Kribbella TaxID=2644121 RepID=UPI0034039B3D
MQDGFHAYDVLVTEAVAEFHVAVPDVADLGRVTELLARSGLAAVDGGVVRLVGA